MNTDGHRLAPIRVHLCSSVVAFYAVYADENPCQVAKDFRPNNSEQTSYRRGREPPMHADERRRTSACSRVHRRFQTTALVPFLFYQPCLSDEIKFDHF